MLSTEELKNNIILQISNKLGKVDWSKIFFKEGNDASVEGIYVFTKNNKYHFLLTEKGKIRSDVATESEEEILLNVYDVFSFNIAMEYAMQFRVQGQDFRRKLFEKEIENYSFLGEGPRKIKEKEIEKILEKAPYNDI